MLFSDRMQGVGPLYTVRNDRLFLLSVALHAWTGHYPLGVGDLLWKVWVPLTSTTTFSLAIARHKPWASHQLPLSTWETKKKLLLTCKMHSVTKGTSRWEFQLKTITFTLWWINNSPGHRREVPPHWGSTGHDPRLLSCSKVQQSGIVRHHLRLWKSSSSCVTWNVSPHQVFQSRENGKLLLVLKKEISFDEP